MKSFLPAASAALSSLSDAYSRQTKGQTKDQRRQAFDPWWFKAVQARDRALLQVLILDMVQLRRDVFPTWEHKPEDRKAIVASRMWTWLKARSFEQLSKIERPRRYIGKALAREFSKTNKKPIAVGDVRRPELNYSDQPSARTSTLRRNRPYTRGETAWFLNTEYGRDSIQYVSGCLRGLDRQLFLLLVKTAETDEVVGKELDARIAFQLSLTPRSAAERRRNLEKKVNRMVKVGVKQ